MQYFYSLDGAAQQGPVDAAGLRAAGARPDTMVWREGMTDWQPAGQVPELAGLFPVAAPPPQALPRGVPPGGPVLNYPPPGYGPPGHPAVGTNGMAIASFVCGLFGIVTACCFVPSILAIVFGYNARGQIARGHGTGRGWATAGIVLGWVAIVLAIIGVTFRIRHGTVYFNGQPVGF